ncbi:hypothetical protein SPF06_21430 [Sinomonas sp. JGH33]|uniref:Uncharacterized protein n=1 Tax=Sinomonas terricola TaxID=3110330 RepID=A0ABU5TCL8_9MICC|nr:hypothetical protein [Sinomonas sp. JGH33]MEA5457287.1 hypothetical protein [Sinomonas sp. JGH33]
MRTQDVDGTTLRLFSEGEYLHWVGPLTDPDGSPRAHLVYSGPDEAMVSSDGRGFFYYPTAEAAALDTGSTVIVSVSAKTADKLVNERP